MVRRASMTGCLCVMACALAACVPPSAAPGTASGRASASSVASSAATGGAAQGIGETTMRTRLEAIPGVRSVELRTVDGFDTGHYQSAALEVGSSDRAAAVAVVDRALAIMWQGPPHVEKHASAWIPKKGSGGVVLAQPEDVDRRLLGAGYEAAMTERYGPWPGRGVPPAR